MTFEQWIEKNRIYDLYSPYSFKDLVHDLSGYLDEYLKELQDKAWKYDSLRD